MAITTDRPVATSPVDSSISCWPGALRSSSAVAGAVRRTPNLIACTPARWVSSVPDRPGREAQVVLDPGRGAGLAAGGDTLDALGVEALGGRVDGGSQPGRAGADHKDVAEGRRRALGADADGTTDAPRSPGCAGSRRPAGITTGVSAGLDPELVEQRLRVLVLLQIDPLMGHPVARQVLPQAPGIRREPRADQLEAGPDADQDRAPGHEGAENDVAERLVLGDELAQLRRSAPG